jgi:hypothetical protein
MEENDRLKSNLIPKDAWKNITRNYGRQKQPLKKTEGAEDNEIDKNTEKAAKKNQKQ